MGRHGGRRLSGDGDPERDVDEELGFHVRQRAEELERQGVAADEARRRAVAEFGDLGATRRYCAGEDRKRLRSRRVRRAARALADETVLACRALARRPAAIAAPVAILAAVVALNALVFTMVRGVLFTPLPFVDAERVAVLDERTEQYGLSRVSYPVLDGWRRQARSLELVAAYSESELPLVTGAEPIRVSAAAVTEGFFELLDRPLLVGRPLPAAAHERGAAPLALISERLWRTAYGADPGILERTIRSEGRDIPVVGVVREGAVFPEDTDLWMALESRSPDLLEVAGAKILVALARIRPGTELPDVASELGGISAAVDGGAEGAAAETVSDRLLGDVRRPLLLLQGAVLLVLLAGCANAGGMLLARGVRRRGELAVRASMGAGARRIAGGLVLEGLVIGVAAGAAGILVAAAALEPALALVPDDLPRVADLTLDPLVAVFALGLAVTTGLATALAPALAGSRTTPATLLREAAPGGGGSAWLRRALEGFVVGQVALAVLLTAGAGLLLRSFLATVREDPGFDPDQVTVVEVSLPEYRYGDMAARVAFARDLLERARGLPGATAVAVGRNLPISGSNMTSPLVLDEGGRTTSAQIALVSADYFDVMRIPIVEGAGFGDADRADGPPVLIVNEHVRTSDGGTLAVGSRAHSYFGTERGPDGMRDVVGIAGGVRHDGLRTAPAPVVYEPFFQKGGSPGFALLVRSTAPPAAVAAEARELLGSMDPELPVDRVGTMAARIARSVAGPRFYTVVLSLFGGLAVVLALAGCQAGLAHRVAARRREIGLRMALGASSPEVRGMVLRRGLLLTAAGAALGLALALPLTRLLESQLYGVTAGDPVTYGGLLVLLFAAAAAASDLPARRAASVDPVETLRE